MRLAVVLAALPFLAAVEVSTDAAGATEEVNPFQEQGDSSQECYAWAADGQCRLNPSHMLSQCKYSCWYAANERATPIASSRLNVCIACTVCAAGSGTSIGAITTQMRQSTR